MNSSMSDLANDHLGAAGWDRTSSNTGKTRTNTKLTSSTMRRAVARRASSSTLVALPLSFSLASRCLVACV
jgi:hypothetical protein